MSPARCARNKVLLPFAGFVALASAGLTGSAGAEDETTGAPFTGGSFRASASADGVRVTTYDPNAPLRKDNQATDGGGPSAHAVLDSVGESNAYASFPFPGVDVATAPALARGAANAPLPPDYPLFVASSAQSVPKQEFSAGPLVMKALSTATMSTSTVSVGGDAGDSAIGLAKSTVAILSTADTVTSEATSQITGLSAGPLQVANVMSRAKVLVKADGTVSREATTILSGAKVGDTAIEVTGGKGPDLEALNSALAGAGVTVELVPTPTEGPGVGAPALRISRRDPAQPNASAVIIKVGGSSAFIDSDATQAAPAASGDGQAAAGDRATSSSTVEPEGVESVEVDRQFKKLASVQTSPSAGRRSQASSSSPAGRGSPGMFAESNAAAVAESLAAGVADSPAASFEPGEGGAGVTAVPATSGGPARDSVTNGPERPRRIAAALLSSRAEAAPLVLALMFSAAAGVALTVAVPRLTKARR